MDITQGGGPQRRMPFPLGMLCATPGVKASISELELLTALRRHAARDWGDVCQEDAQANDDALVHGGRLLSRYRTKDGVIFWFITEADRSATTALLPDEY